MRRAITLSVSSMMLGLAVVASAAPVDLVKARQQNMKSIGAANKAIMDELHKPDGSAAVIQTNAKQLVALAGQVKGQFPAGTGPAPGVPTKALPTIWQNPAKFQAAMTDFSGKAQALLAVSGSGSLDQIRPVAAAVGGTCRSCHEEYRARQQ